MQEEKRRETKRRGVGGVSKTEKIKQVEVDVQKDTGAGLGFKSEDFGNREKINKSAGALEHISVYLNLV